MAMAPKNTEYQQFMKEQILSQDVVPGPVRFTPKDLWFTLGGILTGRLSGLPQGFNQYDRVVPRYPDRKGGAPKLLAGAETKGLDKRLYRTVTKEEYGAMQRKGPEIDHGPPPHTSIEGRVETQVGQYGKAYLKQPGGHLIEHPAFNPKTGARRGLIESSGKGVIGKNQGTYFKVKDPKTGDMRRVNENDPLSLIKTGKRVDWDYPERLREFYKEKHQTMFRETDKETWENARFGETVEQIAKDALIAKADAERFSDTEQGGQVLQKNKVTGKTESDDSHFKAALYEAMRRPQNIPTGAEVHKIAKGLAEGTTTLADLKGTKWSKLRASHKQVLVDGLNWLSEKYRLQRTPTDNRRSESFELDGSMVNELSGREGY